MRHYAYAFMNVKCFDSRANAEAAKYRARLTLCRLLPPFPAVIGSGLQSINMVRRGVGLVGLVILLLAIIAGFLLFRTNQQAQSRDHVDTQFGVIASDIPLCTWEVVLPQRVLTEDTSQSIVILATDPADVDCQSSLTLLAPGFDVTPHKDEQIVTAKPKGQGSIAWILIPLKPGSFEIAVTDGINTRVMGVTVTNILGLTAVQAQILVVAGSLFGPMFTFPWWIDRWQQRKRQRIQTPAPPAQ